LGTVEVLAIASSTPLKETLKVLQSIAVRSNRDREPQNLRGDESIEVTDSLVRDFQFDTDNADASLGMELPA